MHTEGVLALVLITTLTLSPVTPATATAPDQPESADHAVSPVVTDPGPSADSPMGSIGVHGHWEIEVRNPDGSLAARREFGNALFDTGASLLGILLSGRLLVPGSWIVLFNGAPTPCHPPLTGGIQDQCFIVESRSLVAASTQGISKNLVVTVDPLKLSGSITLPMAGSITTVQTVLDVCTGNLSVPANCLGKATATPDGLKTRNLWFTGTSVGPINVLAGQLVTITVTITFSSAP